MDPQNTGLFLITENVIAAVVITAAFGGCLCQLCSEHWGEDVIRLPFWFSFFPFRKQLTQY